MYPSQHQGNEGNVLCLLLWRSRSYSAFRECLRSFVASVVEGQSAVMETALKCTILRSISE